MTDNLIEAINSRISKKDEKETEKKEIKRIEKKEEPRVYPKNNSNRPEDLHETFEKGFKKEPGISFVVNGKELKGKAIIEYVDKNRDKLLAK